MPGKSKDDTNLSGERIREILSVKKGKKKKKKMRCRTGPYDNYIRALCRSTGAPVPKRDTLRMFSQIIDCVLFGCTKSTHELMGTKKKKITPHLAKMGIMSFLRGRGAGDDMVKNVLKMCDDTHKMLLD